MVSKISEFAEALMVWAHHLSCGLTGAAVFGLVAYWLDMGGVRAAAYGPLAADHPIVLGGAALVLVFAFLDRLVQSLLGGPGSL